LVTKNANGVELLHDGAGDGNGFVSHGVVDPSGSAGQVEDVVLVIVFDYTVMDELAVGAAGGDYGDLTIEVDQLFEDARLALCPAPGLFGGRRGVDFRLALAVVAEAGGLENTGDAEGGDGRFKFGERVHLAKGGEREAVFYEELFFAEAVLGGVEDIAVRPDEGELSTGGGGSRRDVLELEGDGADLAREAAHGVEVFVGGDDFEIGDLAGRGIGIGRKGVDAITHAACRNREHAAELAAAEDADGVAGRNHTMSHGSVCSRTMSERPRR
jgi:hypothetical protein